MMNSFELGFVVAIAAVLSAGIILALRPWLQRYVLAHPNSRSSHRESTPQGGGIAVIAATIAVATGIAGIGLNEPLFDLASLWMVFAATVIITLVGAADDIWTIEVAPRLLLQTLAVSIMLASIPPELRVAPILPWWAERMLLLLACLWFVNLTNFMDGIDWMTVAEFVPITVGIGLIGFLGALPVQAVLVAMALCGGLIGFAPFNKPVARIFLGDVGSLPIGLLLSWQLVLLAGKGYVTAALLLPLYYLADATLTLLRRIANREIFWRAHRSHFYQVATDRGFSVPEVIARVFAVNVALVALAAASVVWPGPLSTAAALGCGIVLVGWLLYRFSRGKP
jgi:UDP-N-acetylmuramyl pentapeptide phosphotransferase/UDP-N-acetylglucosamine-1-phosphate transferase